MIEYVSEQLNARFGIQDEEPISQYFLLDDASGPLDHILKTEVVSKESEQVLEKGDYFDVRLRFREGKTDCDKALQRIGIIGIVVQN